MQRPQQIPHNQFNQINPKMIGNERQSAQIEQEKTKPLSKQFGTFSIVVVVICVLFISSGVVLSAVFAGIASQKDCPDCVCPAPFTNEDAMKIQGLYDEGLDSEKILISRLTEGKEFGFQVCVQKCYDNFVTCKTSPRKEECLRNSGITRDCASLDQCLGQCNVMCPLGTKTITPTEDGKCLNKFNFFEVCPSSSEK